MEPKLHTPRRASGWSDRAHGEQGSANQVSLSWLTSTDNVGVTGYNIYRGGVRLATSSTDGVYFSQREASRFQPQLVVTF